MLFCTPHLLESPTQQIRLNSAQLVRNSITDEWTDIFDPFTGPLGGVSKNKLLNTQFTCKSLTKLAVLSTHQFRRRLAKPENAHFDTSLRPYDAGGGGGGSTNDPRLFKLDHELLYSKVKFDSECIYMQKKIYL